MGSAKDRFDYRLAIRERERAIRRLESMLNRSARSDEELDRTLLAELQAMVTGHSRPASSVIP